MSQNEKARQLKNLFISPAFQAKLMSYFVGLFLISTVSLYSTTYLFFWRFKQKGLNVGIPEGHVFYQFLSNQKHDLDILFIGLAAFNLLLLIAVGFAISHRIAGPIHKLKNHLENLTPNSPDYKLRQTDFFKDLEVLVNDLRNKTK